MFRNQVKIAVRSLLRHKVFTLINVAGLAVGLACSLVIVLHIAYEFSFDRQQASASRTYRLTDEYKRDQKSFRTCAVPAIPPLTDDLPEVEAGVRLFTYSWEEKALLAAGAKSFYEERFFLADPSVLDFFAIPLVRGDARTALASPGQIVLSESAARRYFGSDDPIGKILSVKNLTPMDFFVAGVFRDMPANVHFHADFIAPLEAGERLFWKNFLTRGDFFTYIRLRPNVSAADVERKLPAIFGRSKLGPDVRYFSFRLQRLTDIHLRSHLSDEIEPNGDIQTLLLLAILGAVILAGAVINFVNLATARSESRAREIGLRKVIGARRPQIARQFLAESFVLVLAAVPPALLLASAMLPAFNALLQTRLSLNAVPAPTLFAALASLVIVVGLAAGSYPAFRLSAFAPAAILRSAAPTGSCRSLSRSVLVVVQSAGAIMLTAGTLIVLFQMRFIQNRRMGFDKDQVVVLPLKDQEAQAAYPVLKEALARNPNILHVSASESLPSAITRRHPAWHEGAAAEVEEPILYDAVDYDFLETYGMELAEGRNFSRDFPSDEKRGYILNEAAARAFGWTRRVGKAFALSNKNLMRPMFEKGEIIGVVRDFHSQSLHKPIEPVVLGIQKNSYGFAAVKLRRGRIPEMLAFLAETWKRVLPGRPFDYSFFDEDVAKMYASERRTGRMFGAGALLSLFIAALGLVGLASYSASRRTKEIGIRKTLGASVRDITILLAKEFAGLFLLANVLAWPIAYYFARRWLRGFAYGIGANPVFFLLASAAAFLVLIVSVGSQAVKAAQADPSETLRYE